MSTVFLTEFGIKDNAHAQFIQHVVRSIHFSIRIRLSFRKQDEKLKRMQGKDEMTKGYSHYQRQGEMKTEQSGI